MLSSLSQVLILILPLLGSIAFMTLAERKIMGSMQRRLGPNKVGFYGILQPFSDGIKLILKEAVLPVHAHQLLFILAPVLSLVTSFLGWAVIPFGAGLSLSDMNLGLLYILAMSSLGSHGIIFAGWAANNKYSFLGSLRSTAQVISYEIVLGLTVLTVVAITGSLNLTDIYQWQQCIWFIVPLLPVTLLFFVAVIAELNRAPFDLPEAESELVSGFMTEHSSVPFVMFFLAEYGSVVLWSTITALLFLGGPYLPLGLMPSTPAFVSAEALILGVKVSLFLFLFIWVRASFPRLRYDQLMILCWTGLLPLSLALVVLVLSVVFAFQYTTPL